MFTFMLGGGIAPYPKCKNLKNLTATESWQNKRNNNECTTMQKRV